MGYRLSIEQMDGILASLAEKYRIFAPRHMKKRGGETVRYGEISSVNEIVTDVKSDFSPKEVIYPIVQTMLYFTGDTCTESEADDKGILLLARACDINGIKRLDTIFLENGNHADSAYARLREKLKIVLLECGEGWESCFCVSMNANRTEDYSLALGLRDGEALVEVRDEDLAAYFQAAAPCDFTPQFVEKNQKTVRLPQINKDDLPQIHSLDMWKEYDSDCISCGGCNTVCPTCSCFDTVDISYHQSSRDGERRRVWSSCMLDHFTTMAGGHGVRSTPGQRMRFKVLHKVYDFKSRFGGENMCVGCGRCDVHCPKDISYSDAVNRLSEEVERMGKANE